MDLRLAALRRFATAITVLNILGHSILGFEESWAQMFVAMFTAYSCEILLEWLESKSRGTRCRFLGGGVVGFIDFMLPSHISALAVSMLLFANDRLLPYAFAASVAICSKAIFRVKIGKGKLHFLNPSNTGIAVTLLLFPSVGIAPGWQFTANVGGVGNWLFPYIVVGLGSFLNTNFTKRMPLIVGWFFGFIGQAVIRYFLFNNNLYGSLVPITGFAFILFTFYMVTDPATTPIKPKPQLLYGLSVAMIYSVFQALHLVYGLFLSLFIVCSIRGAWIHFAGEKRQEKEPEPLLSQSSTGSSPIPVPAMAYQGANS